MDHPDDFEDSLDRVEREIAREQVVQTILADKSLTERVRRRLVEEVTQRLVRGDFDEDDNTSAVPARKPGPNPPPGTSAIALPLPEDPAGSAAAGT